MSEREEWALALFRRSVLKQRKLRELQGMLGSTAGLRCLDLGSDNGVVSLLLRRAGGEWASADLTEEAVASIRELVGSDVHLVRGESLPFPDRSFDSVAVVDMLEHVPDDRAFVAELARILRPGGTVVVNTPHLKHSALKRLRDRLGLIRLESHHTYSRFFSELVDTALNAVLARLGKKGSAKGMVVTGQDVKRHRRLFLAYSAIYPFVWAVSRLDGLLFRSSGYMLIARAVRGAA
jgi:ubiquinone/menaquinone biosynthesis C-methylase UbiE